MIRNADKFHGSPYRYRLIRGVTHKELIDPRLNQISKNSCKLVVSQPPNPFLPSLEATLGLIRESAVGRAEPMA